VDVAVRQPDSATLTVTGTAPASAFGFSAPGGTPQSFDLQVTAAALNLAVLEVFTDQISDVTGTVAADLRVTGTREIPRVVGRVDITNSAFVLAATGAQYQGFTSALAFEGDRIRIEKFRIADDDGDPLDVSGQLAVSGLRPGVFEATFRAQNFEVIDNELGDIDADAELTVRGELTAPMVTGDVRIRSGRLQVDNMLERLKSPGPVTADAGAGESNGGAPETEGVQTGAAAPATNGQPARPGNAATRTEARPAAGGVAMDVNVVVPNNLVLRGSDLRPANTPMALGDVNITLGGEFALRKPAGSDPMLVGTIRTVRGTYEFQNRRFEILSDGRILFHGKQPIDPGLDITAERQISGVIAQVRVGGTARQPTIDLRSEPPLEESEILSLIVFNRPLNQLSEGQRVNVAERAGAMATGMVVTPLAQSLERALDVDIFEIRGFGEEGGGPVVHVGEQIGERVFLSLEQGFGAQELTEFMLEYQLSEFLRLKGSIAEGAGRANRSLTRRVERSGIDLVLLMRY
jgi:translocation and assembly module TamB